MRKPTKSSTKKNTTQTTCKSDEAALARKAVQEGHTLIELSKSDLESLIGILSIASQTFSALATSSAETNNDQSYGVFAARARLSQLFSQKFSSFKNIGEPESKLPH